MAAKKPKADDMGVSHQGRRRMHKRQGSSKPVKVVLYHEDEEVLVRATDLLVQALGDRVSMSTVRRSRDGSDYHIIFHLELEAGQRGG
jgi:hypothetical protein